MTGKKQQQQEILAKWSHRMNSYFLPLFPEAFLPLFLLFLLLLDGFAPCCSSRSKVSFN